MKKKLLAILMTMAMTFSLAACGSDSGETRKTVEEEKKHLEMKL